MNNLLMKSCVRSMIFLLGTLLTVNSSFAASDPLDIFVSILPQKFFVERIAGGFAHVEVMVGPGKSPETYEPSPKQLVKLASADLYFSIGVPFESSWMDHIKGVNEQIRVVDTASEALAFYNLPEEEDPHIWVSPELAQIIAKHVFMSLVEAAPENETAFTENYELLLNDLEKLDSDIREMLGGWIGKGTFLVMHPAWGFFAKNYGLTQIAIEHEGKSPAAKSLQALINTAKEKEIQVVFIQDQHSSRMAETVASSLSAKVVRLDPLAENYIENMRKVATAVLESFK